MASALNKRQQARNERALQELIRTVPGNDRCADCTARNPGWASWSLGIFLCMRCAALHRKLGTHVSKVKSLSMDSWNNDQVDHMKRTGNATSNRLFNPGNVKPSMPIDIDEVDGAMERYIRQKYEQRAFTGESRPGTRHNTGSTSSDDRPPPLPPKPGRRFGFGLRAASSTFPISRSGKGSPPVSPGLDGFAGASGSPTGPAKASKVFGSNIGGSDASFDSKLAVLREMGFQDEKRNITVLKGLNGNVDRTVETLIRLGEGGREPSRSRTPAPAGSTTTNGISIEREQPKPSQTDSNNPFNMLDHAPPPTTQPQVAPNASQPAAAASNPFLNPSHPAPQPSGLEETFNGLQVSQPQRLFPNSTGGYGNNPQGQHNPYLQSFTPPPMPHMPPQYRASIPQPVTGAPPQRTFSPPQHADAGSNPFLRSTRSQIFSSTNPFEQRNGVSSGLTYPTQQQQPIPPQPTAYWQEQPQLPPQPSQQYLPAFAPQQSNPYLRHPGQVAPQQQWHDAQQQWHDIQQQQQPPPPHPLQTSNPQPPRSHDKASILALYNLPKPASIPTTPDTSTPTPSSATIPTTTDAFHPPQRSVTMPVPSTAAGRSASRNPFAPPGGVDGSALAPPQPSGAAFAPESGGGGGGAVAAPPPPPSLAQPSRESVDFAGLMGGRQSPDAFAGLSSRFVR